MKLIITHLELNENENEINYYSSRMKFKYKWN
jgi:hypothetical protein